MPPDPNSLFTPSVAFEQALPKNSSELAKSRTAYALDAEARPRRARGVADEVSLAQSSAFGGSANTLTATLPGCTTAVACAYSPLSIKTKDARARRKNRALTIASSRIILFRRRPHEVDATINEHSITDASLPSQSVPRLERKLLAPADARLVPGARKIRFALSAARLTGCSVALLLAALATARCIVSLAQPSLATRAVGRCHVAGTWAPRASRICDIARGRPGEQCGRKQLPSMRSQTVTAMHDCSSARVAGVRQAKRPAALGRPALPGGLESAASTC